LAIPDLLRQIQKLFNSCPLRPINIRDVLYTVQPLASYSIDYTKWT